MLLMVEDSKNTTNTNETKDECRCYVCHRTESECGHLLRMPNNINVCDDCMQKTFDSISGFNIGPFFDMDSFNATNGNMDAINTDASSESDNSNVVEDDKDKDSKNQSKGTPIGNVFDFGGFPGMINLSDLQGFLNPNQKVKPKAKKENGPEIKPVFSIDNIPHPHQIKEKLDEYVIGQEQAKKVMSVAVYNHYKRVKADAMDDIEIEKSNILMIGPTGSGKTYMVKTLAKLLDVPLAISDATALTEAGYIGDDIESVLSKLLTAAGNDVERAEKGIVFIDEIDKLAKKKSSHQRDVSGEAVQQGMLKLLEGAEIEIPVGATSKSAMVPLTTIDTSNILFIVGGAFPNLADIVKERLNKSSSMGFAADLRDKYDDDKDILNKASVEDLRNFGMIPEFLGRLPVKAILSPLNEDMLVRILKEPKNAILKQYQKLLALDEVNLKFTDGALKAIANKALEKELGARGLRAIIEDFMLDIMYEVPKDDDIGTVTITEEYISGKGAPIIEMRSVERPVAPVPQIEAAE